MALLEGEIVILNERAKKGLPNRIGERGVVSIDDLNLSNYQYILEFDDGSTAPVHENEVNRLTEEDKIAMEFIFTGNKVLHVSNEEAVIKKVDYTNKQAEIHFIAGGSDVVEFVKLNPKSTEETEPKSRTDLHREVIEEIHNTFKIKNADYGNSFGEQYEEYGLLSAVIRLDDKMRRLKQLMKQDAQVKDESIRDTVLDLANYAIMTVMELDKGGI
jgi:hypothetical protein